MFPCCILSGQACCVFLFWLPDTLSKHPSLVPNLVVYAYYSGITFSLILTLIQKLVLVRLLVSTTSIPGSPLFLKTLCSLSPLPPSSISRGSGLTPPLSSFTWQGLTSLLHTNPASCCFQKQHCLLESEPADNERAHRALLKFN